MARKLVGALSALGLLLGLPAAGSAATINQTYSFTLSNFYSPNGPAPIPVVTGSFSLNGYDSTVAYNNSTSVTTLNSLSIPLSSSFGLTSFTSGQFAGDVFLGGILNNADFVSGGTNDVVLGLRFDNPSAPTFIFCSSQFACANPPGQTASGSGYGTSATTGFYQAISPSITTLGTPGPVAGAGLVPLLAFAGACLFGRKRFAA